MAGGLGALVVAMIAVLLPPAAQATTKTGCSGDPGVVHRFAIPIPAKPRTGIALWTASHASGIYALPSGRPKGLVVFAHGHGNTPEGAWPWHLERVARDDGVIAVAMDYYGDANDPHIKTFNFPLKPDWGWRVAEGADYSIAAARAFDKACPRLKTIVMYGVSMGGNTAGLAVAARAHRASNPRRPLFDYLVDVEGVVNMTETYLEGRAVAVAVNSASARLAPAEIEEEVGGTPLTQPARFAQRTVNSRLGDIAGSGVKGIIVVHAVDDGLVGYNESREFVAGLAVERVPVDLFTVGTRNRPDNDTTLDGYATGMVPGFKAPLVGHAWEGSPGPKGGVMNVVIKTGFDRLAALLAGQRPGCYREFLVNGRPDGSSVITPDPNR
jgi:hypothetical protein